MAGLRDGMYKSRWGSDGRRNGGEETNLGINFARGGRKKGGSAGGSAGGLFDAGAYQNEVHSSYLFSRLGCLALLLSVQCWCQVARAV